MSKETEEKLGDMLKWYQEHACNAQDPLKRMAFCMKAAWHFLWLATYIVEDIQRLEHRDKRIQLPVGFYADEPMRTPDA